MIGMQQLDQEEGSDQSLADSFLTDRNYFCSLQTSPQVESELALSVVLISSTGGLFEDHWSTLVLRAIWEF